jgi:hypothetical protein
MPRRLTFDGVGGADRSPSVAAGVLAYSRLSDEVGSRERCIALLPPEGGTLLATLCPPPPPVPDDSVVTWVEPVVSPDGARIAYVYEKSYQFAVLAASDRELRVAPIDDPADVEFSWETYLRLPDNRLVNAVMNPSWRDSVTIRFLAAEDYIPKVKGGGAERFTDTTLVPKALMDVNLVTGEATVVPGADSAVAYAPAPDGGTWLVVESDRTRLLHQALGSSEWVEVGFFSRGVLDLVQVDGLAVAVLTDSSWVEVLDPSTGVLDSASVPPGWGWVLRIAAVPGSRRLVAEVEQPVDQFGGPANLWLMELPP